MTGSLKKLYHIVAFAWYTFIVQYLYYKGKEDAPPGIFPYGGPWKYLTFINLMVFFGLAAVRDFQPLRKDSKVSVLCLFKDLLFSVFAFPVGMFVVLLFWMIFTYDRQLVYPASLDGFFPPWLNHAMHSLVLPILLGEMMLEPHIYPKARNGLVVLLVAGLLYSGWIIWVYMSVGIWVYPLLGLFRTPGLIAFFLSNLIIIILLYLMGQNLSCKIWGKAKRLISND